MSAQIKMLKNSSEMRVCYNNNRAISTIIKLDNGNYRVIKLYEAEAKDCDTYSEAREEAMKARPIAV